jgi:hypothetical protein
VDAILTWTQYMRTPRKRKAIMCRDDERELLQAMAGAAPLRRSSSQRVRPQEVEQLESVLDAGLLIDIVEMFLDRARRDE